MGVVTDIRRALMGEPVRLPDGLLARYPELRAARWRRGGLAVRVGGWALGQSTAAAITLWRTVFLAPSTRITAELLLHEVRHIHQFEASRTFPLRYLWESVRRGYRRNRFELDARDYAAARLRASSTEPSPEDS